LFRGELEAVGDDLGLVLLLDLLLDEPLQQLEGHVVVLPASELRRSDRSTG